MKVAGSKAARRSLRIRNTYGSTASSSAWMRGRSLPIPLVVALVLLTMASAGCITSQGGVADAAGGASTPGAADAPGDANASAPDSLMKIGCRETFVSVEVPAELVADQLPEGFEPIPQPGLSVGVRPTAWFVMVSAHCEATEVGDQRIPDAQSFWYAVAVDPPEKYERGDAFVHFYPLGILVGKPSQADHLEAWDLPVHVGDVGSSILAEDDRAWVWDVHASTDEVDYSLQAVSAGRQPMHDITVRMIHVGDDGNATAVDLSPQGNTNVSYGGSFTFDLQAPDSPLPVPAEGIPYALSNVKVTPPDRDALRWRHQDL